MITTPASLLERLINFTFFFSSYSYVAVSINEHRDHHNDIFGRFQSQNVRDTTTEPKPAANVSSHSTSGARSKFLDRLIKNAKIELST